MLRVEFTPQLSRFVEVGEFWADGDTVRAVLDNVFQRAPELKGYVLDDQSRLRKHVNVFVDAAMVTDRQCLSDRVDGAHEIFVMQALSGG